jgi:polyisoprenoid-binding protein YceI
MLFNHRNVFTAFAVVAAFSSSLAMATKWEIDPSHSTVKFKVKHLMVSNVYGSFSDLKGTIDLDEKTPAKTSAEITIGAASVNTENAKRDEHLKSPDFFDVTNHPTITFKTTKVTKDGKKKYKMAGDLTMRGVTKPITFNVDEVTDPVKDFQGGLRRGLSATAKLNRKDWGVSWNKSLDKGGLAVSENVDVTVDLELAEAKTTTETKTETKSE